MIVNDSLISFDPAYLELLGLDISTSVFFDIETTGFKAGTSHLYLIGAAWPDTDFTSGSATACKWHIRQWMAEYPQEETGLLRTFLQFLSDFQTLIHFNGDRFDIPYLQEKYEQYGIPSPFLQLQSVDLYRLIRPLKSLLKLEHLNQKSLEVFLGLKREDPYDGGELIKVYRNFCKTKDAQLVKILLLHNREDVSGMFLVTSLLSYLQFSGKGLSPQAAASANSCDNKPAANLFQITGLEQITEQNQPLLLLTAVLCHPVPVPVSNRLEFAPDVTGYLTIHDNIGKFLLPVADTTLLYFFPDYKNYYYLPEEDQAIHKAVASYVDKNHREPARASNCYIKKTGRFLPQTAFPVSPAFSSAYEAALTWFEITEERLTDPAFWISYIASLV